MICDRFKTRLEDFALGAEDPELCAHVDSCASCRAVLDTQRALLDSIDRGLTSMVAGEPAGDFAAHVRQRIAQEGITTRPWFAGWLPITATALALVVLVTFLMLRRDHAPTESVKETPPAQTARPPREPQLAQKAPEISVPSSASGPRMIRPPRPPQPAALREPEVLVPRGEMAAVMRLFHANWEGNADGASLMAAAIPTTESLKPLTTAELKILPLEIVPLAEEGKPNGSSDHR